jgi:hypothetical protein
MKIGWYSEQNPMAAEKSVLYFNHIVNFLTPNADHNDARIYTKENYINCLKNLPLYELSDVHDRFIVQLPYFQVYNDEKGNDIVIFDWYKDIVDATFDLPQIHGYYIADEPEVWGTPYTSIKTPFDKDKAAEAFSYIKSKCNKPVLLVFCDRDLFVENGFAPKINQICDVLGFDYYPFMTKNQIKQKNLGFEPDSQEERDWIERELKGFARLYDDLDKRGRKPPYFAFVTQGCGEFTDKGVLNFGQRDFTRQNLDFLYTKLVDIFEKQPDYYLFWDKSYADNNAFATAWDHILKIESLNYQIEQNQVKKQPIFKRIARKIKKLLRL